MGDAPEFHLFLPQMRLSPDGLVDRARAAEAAGFAGLALMDHLAPPQAEDRPMFEAMTMATWLAARTERLTIGHLVLCDSFRHPAVLARQAVTLDHLSGGRYELALGSGSTPAELRTFGVSEAKGPERAARLRETLDVVTQLWTGEPVTFEGRFHQMTAARQWPTPTRPIPVVIGGTGPATLQVVRDHATWWNLPAHHIDRLEACRPLIGAARVSLQQLVTFVPAGTDRAEIVELADRRFGWMGHTGRAVGGGDELVASFEAYRRQGVERFYLWFTDFAHPDTLGAFGAEVIARLA
ncbi:MAG TPA: LLM class flavin-dependent oxidoreductase [Acidimicrobiales bacterium]|jgi:alkanesulfonate monooxygenase SsuD/methylene tetrahydromethanopterin reductase-like flavin-dependent oxidoreductase (luciferase family)